MDPFRLKGMLCSRRGGYGSRLLRGGIIGLSAWHTKLVSANQDLLCRSFLQLQLTVLLDLRFTVHEHDFSCEMLLNVC